MNIKPHQIILLIADFFLINLVFILTIWFQYQSGFINKIIQSFPYHFMSLFFLFSIIAVIFFHFNHLYKYQTFTKRYEQFFQIIKSFVFSFIVIILVAFALKHELLIQRLTISISFIILCTTFFIFRCLLLPIVYNAMTGSGDLKKNIIIIGAGDKGRKLCKHINTKKNSYFSAIGFLDDKSSFQRRFFDEVPVFGRITDISKVARINKIDEILIAIDNLSHERLLDIVGTCSKIKKPIHVVSDLYKVIPSLLEVEKFDGISTFRVRIPSSKLLYYSVKRIVDITISAALLVGLLPLITLIGLLIKFTSKGPIFFKREVVGKGEKVFTFYKFRTMYNNNDDSQHKKYVADLINGNAKNNGDDKKAIYKIKNDPRITKIGKYLRTFSFDELPQLFNVLKGEMSLIGPRPCTVDEYMNYKCWHKERFAVTPGITGLYQVTARNSVQYDDMVVLDLYYKEHQSFWLDMEILFKTIPTMLFGKGAY